MLLKLFLVWPRKQHEDESSSFALRLVAFTAVEGIFFSGSFAAIYLLKKRGLLPGLTFSNELIREGLYTDFACLLFTYIKKHPAQSVIQDLIREAVDIEKELLTDALSESYRDELQTHVSIH